MEHISPPIRQRSLWYNEGGVFNGGYYCCFHFACKGGLGQDILVTFLRLAKDGFGLWWID